MRILHLMNWFMQDLGYQENYLPFYQAELGNDVCILCSKYYPKRLNFDRVSNGNITYFNGKLKIKRLDSFFIRGIAEQNWYLNLAKEINYFNPDIIHSHNIWDLHSLQLLITAIQNKNRIKVFVDNHIDNGNFNYSLLHKRLYYFWFIKKIIIPIMLKKNFLFLSVNPYSNDCLQSYFSIPGERIKLLFLGIDNEMIFFSQDRREQLRKKYGVDKEDIVFVYSGVFEKSKSLKDLLDAFKLLAKEYTNIYLLLIGRGDLDQDDEFKSLRERKKIILPGWQSISELYKWYSMADVGVLPGKLGGIKDILAAGKPLIINSDLAVSYLVEYGNGMVFPRGNMGELITKLKEYIQNPDLIQKHGEQSLRLVNDKLSWRNIALESLDLYSGR